MVKTKTRYLLLSALLASLILALALSSTSTRAHGLDQATPAATAAAGTMAPTMAATLPAVDLSGATFTVGSKDFSEQIILAQITEIVLKQMGATVVDKSNIKGSVNTRTALTSGAIDMYWEYTGTAWITYQKQTKPIPDPVAQYKAVADADLKDNKIKWLSMAPFNDTYAMAVLQTTADQLNVKTLSDVAALALKSPDKVTFCVESEFSTRDDGLPGMLKAYDMKIPPDNIKSVDTGVIYTETAKGQTCTFGEVFATDGRIAALKLAVMADDKNFFPNYNVALTMRSDTFNKYPQLADLFAPIAALLDNTTMQKLNAEADVDGKDPADIAAEWLKSVGFTK
jgi:osmoprotectant transport system substrate-binding protein